MYRHYSQCRGNNWHESKNGVGIYNPYIPLSAIQIKLNSRMDGAWFDYEYLVFKPYAQGELLWHK